MKNNDGDIINKHPKENLHKYWVITKMTARKGENQGKLPREEVFKLGLR